MMLLLAAAPAVARPAPLDRASVLARVKQVWAAGTWDEQRAAFDRLREPERSAVWAMMTNLRPGPVQVLSSTTPPEPTDYAPAPKPRPRARPGTDPARPPVVTPPAKVCSSETALRGYYLLDDPETKAFAYAATLNWCFISPSVTGPLTEYSSFSFAYECCLFPWTTDPAKYIDRLVGQPAANTQKILDHHTGWFEAEADAGPVSAGLTNTPNIDSSVLGDGSYVCGA
ncbi:MAG TPA: hypothetical protein VNA20_11495 [Frankiaceae bacterium]|nr:hypothetical protein [Frankiaceae bacterium]